MKHLVVSLLFIIGMTQTADAQLIHPNAIGVRGGSGSFGLGGEISYQKGLSDANRLELDFGFRRSSWSTTGGYRHLTVAGIYHWVFGIGEGFNWYVGPGSRLGLYSNVSNSNFFDGGFTVAVGGQIGVEFDFNTLNLPLQISLDVRPMLGVIGSNSGFGYGASLGIRYTF